MHNVSEGKQSEAHLENRVSQACTAVDGRALAICARRCSQPGAEQGLELRPQLLIWNKGWIQSGRCSSSLLLMLQGAKSTTEG